jgi:octaprenyl-diphosphate synthase
VSVRTRIPATSVLREIQAPVRERLDRVIDEMSRILTVDSPIVQGVKDHLMLMKGKMMRPTLTLLSSAVEGTPGERTITLAACGELIHLATLIHDDAVDHSVLRRGMPTLNALFSHQVSVIMGDYLYSRTVTELVRLGDLDALRVYSSATDELTLGEMRQLGAVDALQFSEQDYELLIRSKTASLFAACCEVGAMHDAPRYRRDLADYGNFLGMAFQVADDLLDYTESSDTVGKPTGLDLREHKVTLPLIAALRTMPRSARERVELLFATPEPGELLIADVVEIVREEGGLEYARRRGEEFASRADDALRPVPEGPARTSLAETIGYVMDRRS